ncbi:MAG: hypothetical protein EPN53_00970 [Acidobacteria bacterium]|nr:MAG: hypothetical protein EPN53_00970 [Acidobacteriota bacterium]
MNGSGKGRAWFAMRLLQEAAEKNLSDDEAMNLFFGNRTAVRQLVLEQFRIFRVGFELAGRPQGVGLNELAQVADCSLEAAAVVLEGAASEGVLTAPGGGTSAIGYRIPGPDGS